MKKLLLTLSLLSLVACNQPQTITVAPETGNTYPERDAVSPPYQPKGPPPHAFDNPGDPERLLDKSSELVTMSLGSRGALNDISRTIMQDPPTRAELNCNGQEALCAEAKSIFANQRIPFEYSGNGDDVTLVYERVVARDCDSRYVDNSKNSYNAYMPSLGCSVVANTMQMVSDKAQFTNPNLMDLPDGQKATQNYRRYQQPPAPPKDNESLLKTIRTE